MRRLVFLILLSTCISASADLYKWTDKDGNIIYSDKPNPSGPSEKVKGKPMTTYKPSSAVQRQMRSNARPTVEQQERVVYKEFAITEPANDTAIRDNAGNIAIKFKIDPAPSGSRGHRIDIYLDGKKTASTSGTSYQFSNLNRGTHTVQAKLVDGAGKVFKTASVTFHLQRFFKRN